MQGPFKKIARFVEYWLNHPVKVLWVCLFIVFLNLIVDGTLLRLWSLHRNIDRIEKESMVVQSKIQATKNDIQNASDPDFLEREARDRFELVSEDDLVFVFAETQ